MCDKEKTVLVVYLAAGVSLLTNFYRATILRLLLRKTTVFYFVVFHLLLEIYDHSFFFSWEGGVINVENEFFKKEFQNVAYTVL